MLEDRYGNALTTVSKAARDAYVEGTDCLLAANVGGPEALQEAIAADESFALAHAALARCHQVSARAAEAKASMARARALSDGLSVREQGHVAMLGNLIDGKGSAAYETALAHLRDYPRDALVAQPLTGVFGLIGFSGKPGREAELLAFLTSLAPHYGDDWWFGAQLAFAQIEVGQAEPALRQVERALERNPRNANGAHVLAHIHYEIGEGAAGLDRLRVWMAGYEREGVLHCHLNWHVALWLLERGEVETAWGVVDEAIRPGVAWGPPINVLTDYASFRHRSELAGVEQQPDRWREVADYARACFPRPGLAFADLHRALASAMAGNDEDLSRVVAGAAGPAGDLVAAFGEAFGAFAGGDWEAAIALLGPRMAQHERIGGSRAQRDLLEMTLAGALLRAGRADEARLMLLTRRPVQQRAGQLAGLQRGQV